jgi:NTP pyrophosphatase (non-canonical NTP hydrolase)
MKKIIESNYKSIVKRGLISPSTNIYDFLDKLEEEKQELKKAVEELDSSKNVKQKHFDNINEELADVILVCLNMAKHFKIDIEKELNNKIKVNEERAKKNNSICTNVAND